MGEVIRVRFGGSGSGARPALGSLTASAAPPPRIVHQDRGWRILRVPRLGRYLALSARCRAGITVGDFDPCEERGGGREPQQQRDRGPDGLCL